MANKQTKPPFSAELWQQIQTNRAVRLELATKDLYSFAHIYFGEYIRYPTADFQKEFYKNLASDEISFLVTVAFRGSGKSTIATLISPLWSLLGSPGKKMIVLISLNQSQARTLLQHIKRLVESNELLRKDFGPLEEDSDEWGATSLVFAKYDARVAAVSIDQSTRGIRHGAHRPDLIIADDVEDLNSMRNKENRDKVYQWFTGEIIPLGDIGTKFVVVGNKLHEDSLVMRLSRRSNVTYREYPLLDDKGKCLWPAKYPNEAATQNAYEDVGDRITWHREFLLQILPSDEQIIHPDWIKYYSELPQAGASYSATIGMGVDLAISQKQTADKTAMVIAEIRWEAANKFTIYIYPNPFNKRITHLVTIETIRRLYSSFGQPKLYVEDVGYQRSVIEQLQSAGIYAKGVRPNADKRSRLMAVSYLVQAGQVRFAEKGCEELIGQLLGFGVENRDDLVDAFCLVVSQLILERKYSGLIEYYRRLIKG